MKHILIASDSAAVRDEVKAVLSEKEFTVREVTSGDQVLPAIKEKVPDLVVCDLQIGNRGGMATALDLRHEESAGRLPRIAILLLLDRRADVFLAHRSEVDGFLVKPLDPIRMRRAITTILQGDTYADASYRPAESAAKPVAPTAAGA